jgi:hypothetical protein
MLSAAAQLDSSAQRVAWQGPSAEDAVDLIHARVNMAANVKTAQIADEMQKSVIDLTA